MQLNDCYGAADIATPPAEGAVEIIVVLKATVGDTLPYNNNEKVLVQVPDNGNCAAQSIYVSVFGKLPSILMLQHLSTQSIEFLQSDTCKQQVEGFGNMSLIDSVQQELQQQPVVVTAVEKMSDGSLLIHHPTQVEHEGPVRMMLTLSQYFKLLRHPKNMFARLELGVGYYYATIFQKKVHVQMVKTSDIYTHRDGAVVGR